MKDLIAALQIFAKYTDAQYPTTCIRKELMVNVDPSVVSKEDIEELCKLGFNPINNYFYSFRFGSC